MSHSFLSITRTSTLLLDGLKQAGNQQAWQEYVDRYRPMLVSYAGRFGLAASDADDAAQQSLMEFYHAYQAGSYDRARGRLRDWLFGIARNQMLNLRRKNAVHSERMAAAVAGGGLDELADEGRSSAVWDEEWRAAVMRQCLAEVRAEVQPATFEAFDLFACQGWPAEKVAQQLGMTANAVFGAKRRVLRRIRELLPAIDADW